MGFLVWILQLIVFLVVWKAVHLLFWNIRRLSDATSLAVTMLVTLLIGIVGVICARAISAPWPAVIATAVLLGVANGEYEYNRGISRNS